MEKYIKAKTVRDIIDQCPAEFLDVPISFHTNGVWTEDFQVRFSDDHQQTVFELEFEADQEQVYIND